LDKWKGNNMKNKIINQHWDEFLREYYLQSCSGCPKGHSSFWRTVIRSKEWQAWKKHNKGTNWDFAENEELGILSEEHFNAFIQLVKKYAFKKKKYEIRKTKKDKKIGYIILRANKK
jgi:hypothetical protein